MTNGIRPNWTDEMISCLGKINDHEISKKYNISLRSICGERKRLGIKAVSQKYIFPDNIEELMLEYSNREISNIIGCHIGTIGDERRLRKIPKIKTIRLNTLYDKVKDLFGLKNDKEIADETGYSYNSVNHVRNKYHHENSKLHKTIENIECKKCGKCKNWKSLDNFYQSKNTWDKKMAYCKDCWNYYVKMRDARKSGWTEQMEYCMNSVFPRVCYWCGMTEKEHKEKYYNWSLAHEHLVPESSGGLWENKNVYLSCCICNSEKGTKDVLEWAVNKYGKDNGLERYNKLVSLLNESERLFNEM